MRLKVLIPLLLGLPFFASAGIKDGNLIRSDAPFRQDSSMLVGIASGLSPEGQTDKSLKRELGQYNGVNYVIYYDSGLGEFAGSPQSKLAMDGRNFNNWGFECRKDEDTRQVMCEMDNHYLHIGVNKQGLSYVRLGLETTPNTSAFINIDGRIIFESGANPGYFLIDDAPRLVGMMMQAKNVSYWFYRGDHAEFIHGQWTPYGFKEAYEFLHWAVKRIP